MLRLLRNETLNLSLHYGQIRHLRTKMKGASQKRSKPDHVPPPFSEAQKNKFIKEGYERGWKERDEQLTKRIQTLMRDQYQAGLSSGHARGFRAGSAKQKIAMEEKANPGSTFQKIGAWMSQKDKMDPENEQNKIKEEFFAMGYAEAQERVMASFQRGFQKGVQTGYSRGFHQGMKKAIDLSKKISSLPKKMENAYFRFLDKLTPKKK